MEKTIKQKIFEKWDLRGVYIRGDVAIELKKMLPFTSRFMPPTSEERQDFEWERVYLTT